MAMQSPTSWLSSVEGFIITVMNTTPPAPLTMSALLLKQVYATARVCQHHRYLLHHLLKTCFDHYVRLQTLFANLPRPGPSHSLPHSPRSSATSSSTTSNSHGQTANPEQQRYRDLVKEFDPYLGRVKRFVGERKRGRSDFVKMIGVKEREGAVKKIERMDEECKELFGRYGFHPQPPLPGQLQDLTIQACRQADDADLRTTLESLTSRLDLLDERLHLRECDVTELLDMIEQMSELSKQLPSSDPLSFTVGLFLTEATSHIRRRKADLIRTIPQKLEIRATDVRREYEVSRGGFSIIWKGKWTTGRNSGEGREVAVKMVKPGISRELFLQHVKLWTGLRHRHITEIYGAVAYTELPFIIMPLMGNGNVRHFIDTNPTVDRVQLVCEVASGLKYLHSRQVVHGDLKGANVLIDDCGQVRLTDFGLADVKIDLVTRTSAAEANVITSSVRWMAPERLAKGHLDQAADIYSFGVTAFEIITSEDPFQNVEERCLPYQVIKRGLRPERPANLPSHVGLSDPIWSLMVICWSEQPDSRPSSSSVADQMGKFAQEHEMARAASKPIPTSPLQGPAPIPKPSTSRPSSAGTSPRVRTISASPQARPRPHIETAFLPMTGAPANNTSLTGAPPVFSPQSMSSASTSSVSALSPRSFPPSSAMSSITGAPQASSSKLTSPLPSTINTPPPITPSAPVPPSRGQTPRNRSRPRPQPPKPGVNGENAPSRQSSNEDNPRESPGQSAPKPPPLRTKSSTISVSRRPLPTVPSIPNSPATSMSSSDRQLPIPTPVSPPASAPLPSTPSAFSPLGAAFFTKEHAKAPPVPRIPAGTTSPTSTLVNLPAPVDLALSRSITTPERPSPEPVPALPPRIAKRVPSTPALLQKHRQQATAPNNSNGKIPVTQPERFPNAPIPSPLLATTAGTLPPPVTGTPERPHSSPGPGLPAGPSMAEIITGRNVQAGPSSVPLTNGLLSGSSPQPAGPSERKRALPAIACKSAEGCDLGEKQTNGRPPLRSYPSTSSMGTMNGPRRSVELSAQGGSPASTLNRRSSAENSPRPNSSDGNWAVRPGLETVYDNISKFFPRDALENEDVHPVPKAGKRASLHVRAQSRPPEVTSEMMEVLANLPDPNPKSVDVESAPEDQETSFRWIRGELIGKGTYGRVYLAIIVSTGEMMACKQVDIPQTASDRADERQLAILAAMRTETKIHEQLEHKNIVTFLGYEETSSTVSIFMEYISGGSIGRMLRKHGNFEELVVKFFAHQILEGLGYLHSKGVIHRDLKSDNLLVDLEGTCKISDFGISKAVDDVYNNDPNASLQGSIFWMAPEVLANQRQGYSAKVDVWSFGCVLLEMFSGKRPWHEAAAVEAMFKLGADKAAPPVPPNLDMMAKHLLGSCFTIDPDKRPKAEKLLLHRFLDLPLTWRFADTSLAKAIKV